MKYNVSMLENIQRYMCCVGWVFAHELNGRASIWRLNGAKDELMLPMPDMLQNHQAESLLDEAMDILAKHEDVSPIDLFKRIKQQQFDMLSIRAHGANVGTGKINFKQGVCALDGFYKIVRYAAQQSITVKGKTKFIKDYMDGIQLLAPQEGSFIYSLQVELNQPEEESNNSLYPDASIGRSVNVFLSKIIQTIHKKSSNDYNYNNIDLIKDGIDGYLCQSILEVFSSNIDGLDFEFNWSILEDIFDDTPRNIKFNKTHRKRIESFKKTLSKETIKDVVDIPVHIEMYRLKKIDTNGRIGIRLPLGDMSYACHLDVKKETYEHLKKVKSDEVVFLTAKLLISSSTRTTVRINSYTSIRVGGGNHKLVFDS